MIINHDLIEEKRIPEFKGGLKEFNVSMFTDEHNKIMRGRLIPGATIGYHKHDNDCEIVYILEGDGKMVNDDGEDEVHPGEVHYCPKGRSHSLQNTGDKDLIFIGIVANV